MSNAQSLLDALRILVNSRGDVIPCTNTTQIATGEGNNWNRIMSALDHPLTPRQQRTSIPIRVRLAIIRTNSCHAAPPADGFLSNEASHDNYKLQTYWPPPQLSSNNDLPTTSDTHDTISDLTKFIVEELFTINAETHFRNHYPSKFLEILLGRDRGSTLPDAVFDYGIKMKNTKFGNGPGTCVIKFSLMEEESEGYPIDISPRNNAYEVLRIIMPENSSTEKLDLILKADVIMCRNNNIVPSLRKRKIVCEDVGRIDDSLNAKRSKKGHAVENHPPDATTEHPNGIPLALSEAWENQQLATSLANEERKAGSKTEMEVEQIPAALSDVECGDDEEGMSVDSDAKKTKSDNKKVKSQPCRGDDVASSTKVDSNKKMLADGASLSSSGGSDENIKGEAAKTKGSDLLTKSKGNNGEEGDDDKGVDADDVKDTDNVPNKNTDSLVVSSNAPVDTRKAGSDEKNKNTTQAEAKEDSSSSESKGDPLSESSSSSISSEEPDDEDNKLLTVSFMEPHEDKPDTKNAHIQDTEEKTTDRRSSLTSVKATDRRTSLASVKATPYDLTVASSDPTFTQESAMSAMVPTILFESKGEKNGANQHIRGGQIKSSSTPLIDKSEKSNEASSANDSDSDTSSSSSSSSDSEESSSDDEDSDDEESNEKSETTLFEVSASPQPRQDNEASQLSHMTQRSNSPASKDGRHSGVSATNKGEETKDNTADAPEAAGDNGGTNNSSSSSSSDSSSGSDSSSSSDSSSGSDSDSSSGHEEEESNQVKKSLTPNLPLARPSRGRRRTPLVNASRKIVIHASNKTNYIPK